MIISSYGLDFVIPFDVGMEFIHHNCLRAVGPETKRYWAVVDPLLSVEFLCSIGRIIRRW